MNLRLKGVPRQTDDGLSNAGDYVLQFQDAASEWHNVPFEPLTDEEFNAIRENYRVEAEHALSLETAQEQASGTQAA